jgi:hypothetical protein
LGRNRFLREDEAPPSRIKNFLAEESDRMLALLESLLTPPGGFANPGREKSSIRESLLSRDLGPIREYANAFVVLSEAKDLIAASTSHALRAQRDPSRSLS